MWRERERAREASEENRRRRRGERVQTGFTESAQRVGTGGISEAKDESLKVPDDVKVHLQMFPNNNPPVESTDLQQKNPPFAFFYSPAPEGGFSFLSTSPLRQYILSVCIFGRSNVARLQTKG